MPHINTLPNITSLCEDVLCLVKSHGNCPCISHGAWDQALTFVACQELLGNKHRLCRSGGVPATLAPTMLTGVLQSSNIAALLIAIYHAFPVCKCLLLREEYKMCPGKKNYGCAKRKKGRKSHLPTHKHLSCRWESCLLLISLKRVKRNCSRRADVL